MAGDDLSRDLVDGRKTRRALAVNSRDRGRNRDAGMKGGHASGGRTTAWRKDVPDVDVLDKCRVEVDLGVYCTENA